MPRSGTTWMMWLLAQHPEIAVLRGSALFMPLQYLENWRRRGLRYTRRAGSDDAGGNYKMHRVDVAMETGEFHEYVRTFCGRVFDAVVQDSPDARVLLDQDPEHIEFIPLISQALPDARFIHVVRDPRAVYCSIQGAVSSWAMPDGFPTSPVHVGRAWSGYAAMAREAAGDDRFLVVQYEKLKANGPEELERIHRWLGLATDRASCEAAIEACKIDRLRSQTTQPKNFYRKGSATGWREEIPRSALRALEYVAGEEMERWGYEREHPRSHVKSFRLRMHEVVGRLVRNRGEAVAAAAADSTPATPATPAAPRANVKGRLPKPIARGLRKMLRTLQLMRSFDLVKIPKFPPMNPRD